MKCSNCGFQNMPGSNDCGRCGTSMGLATAVIDVHPPRAGRISKRIRRALPFREIYNGARNNVVAVRTAAVIERSSFAAPAFPVLWRLIVPGWSHFYLGQRRRGQLFLWSFIPLLLMGMLLLGSTWGSIFLGLAFSAHSSAIMDIDNQADPSRSVAKRIARSAGYSLLLFTAIYMPAGRLLGRVAEPHVISRPMGLFRPDDVVMVRRGAPPLVGQVVLYELPFARLTMAVGYNGHGVRYRDYLGERIDRIVAGPGDSVVWEEGRLTVNGQPSEFGPLMPQRLPTNLSLTVPPNYFLIFPSVMEELPPVKDVEAWRSLSLVPYDHLRGRAYARTQPLTRFEIFR